MHLAASKRVASGTMAVIDALQLKYASEEQVLAVVCAALLLCERYRVPAQDAFTAATNLMNHRVAGMTGMRPEFQAVQAYAAEELT